MSFNANVPQSNQTVASTQSPIQTNFSLINTAFNNSSGNFTQYQFQNVSAPGAQSNPKSALYTKTSNSNSNLFYRNAAGEQQLTGPSNLIATATTGYTTLQGGLILQWVQVTFSGTNVASTNLPIQFPTGILSISATLKSTSSFNALDMIIEGSSYQLGPARIQLNRVNTAGNVTFWVQAWGY